MIMRGALNPKRARMVMGLDFLPARVISHNTASLRCLAYSWTEYSSQGHPIDYRCIGIFEVIPQQ